MVSILDITTAILGLAYILLEYKASLWMWVVGFIMQLLGIILYYEKGLYADCGMEFYYLSMTVYGFFAWQRASRESQTRQRPITHMPHRVILLWGIAGTVLWGVIWFILVTCTDSSVPVADSFTTAWSIVGIWALARKYVEQWMVWIVVDVVTSVLYYYKGIPFKASLYALYVVIAVFGFRRWQRLAAKE